MVLPLNGRANGQALHRAAGCGPTFGAGPDLRFVGHVVTSQLGSFAAPGGSPKDFLSRALGGGGGGGGGGLEVAELEVYALPQGGRQAAAWEAAQSFCSYCFGCSLTYGLWGLGLGT